MQLLIKPRKSLFCLNVGRASLTAALILSLAACSKEVATETGDAGYETAATNSIETTNKPESSTASQPEPSAITRSMVVLGDSVAAGEGINYGYTYDLDSIFGARWVGGTEYPRWQDPYQLCHDSKQAYGEIIANDLSLNLAKFACTGATYDNGLTAKRHDGSTEYRPAEFGNWATQQHLNPDYDAAKPDIVVLTFGADDVNFVGIVEFCVTGYVLDESDLLEQIEASLDPRKLIRSLVNERYPDEQVLAKDKSSGVDRSAPYCTAANPGKAIDKLFWKPINDGTITKHYVDMVNAIKARGTKAGKVPQIVFTTYHNPLPLPSESIDCDDTLDLSRAEINYLHELLGTLNDTIKNAVANIPGVSVADISQVMDGHRWCSQDPWTYGLSIIPIHPTSQAPFHPTPAGQKAIAEIVKAQIN